MATYRKSWRERRTQPREPFNPEKEIEEETYPSPTDYVWRHPENGTNIRVKDNGTAQIFVDDDVGIKLDPNTDSITLFADKLKFRGSTVDFHTDSTGLRWNYNPFNRDMTNPLKEVLTTVPRGAELIDQAVQSSLYLSSSPGSPAAPTGPGMTGWQAAQLSGTRMYRFTRKPQVIAQAVTDITRDIDFGELSQLGGLL